MGGRLPATLGQPAAHGGRRPILPVLSTPAPGLSMVPVQGLLPVPPDPGEIPSWGPPTCWGTQMILHALWAAFFGDSGFCFLAFAGRKAGPGVVLAQVS